MPSRVSCQISVFIVILKTTPTNKELEKMRILYILKFSYSNLMHFESSKCKAPTHVLNFRIDLNF